MVQKDVSASLKWRMLGSAFAAISFCSTLAASAANQDGQYAVRGVGSTTCGELVDSLEATQNLPMPYVAWLGGYVSAINRLERETFDASYVVDNRSLLVLTGRLCAQNRDIILEAAVARVLNFMSDHRVLSQSRLLQLSVGQQKIAIRETVYEAFAETLVEQGFLEGSAMFSEQVRDAIIEFQEARGLRKTGLPDADTLVSGFAVDQ